METERLSIGQMAKLNLVSEKTLRVYHDKGLLLPHHIDPQTGYRYYRLHQCATLDMIQQLKGLGFSLDEIKAVLSRRDVDYFAQQIADKAAVFDDELNKLAVARQTCDIFLSNCKSYNDGHPFDRIVIEEQPPRRIVRFKMRNPRLNAPGLPANRFLDEWELALRLVKRELAQEGYPLSLFRNVGCVIFRKSLLERTVRFDQCFLNVSSAYGPYYQRAEQLPAGSYLTLYCNRLRNKNDTISELEGLSHMLDYIAEKGYEITGDYLGEVVAETPAFLYKGRNLMLKMQIPIRR
jgi:DNA-binding transcriptional MerR regulator